ncbi:MAG: hypothetical protein ACN4GW_19785 [Desulforhopalus sp.]
MDTDDFSDMAWAIIVQAAEVSDTLKTELGAMSSRCDTEDEWLQTVLDYLQEIIEDPESYAESWDLEEYEGVTTAIMNELAGKLHQQVKTVRATPLSKRIDKNDS